MKSRADLWQILPQFPVIAELGCAEGYFSRDMCEWGAKKLYMVDLWDHIPHQSGDGAESVEWHRKNYIEAMERVRGFPVEVLRGYTWRMAEYVPDNSLDLLYVDACHMYECVKRDLQAWYPKVKKGGVIAGHDVNNTDYGVSQAVTEFCGQLGVEFFIIPENGIDASFYFYKP